MGTTRTQTSTTAAPSAVPSCPVSASAVLPETVRDRLVLRVRTIFEHPRMGALVGAFFDDASERAMLLRAERYGYDARSLDRAAIAWTARGSTLYVGRGTFDSSVLTARLYDRLIGQRTRQRDRARNERVTGELATTPVSLLVRPACGIAAYVEGREGALVDRVMRRDLPAAADPESAVYWRTTRTITEVPPEGAALLRYVRSIEAWADPTERGLRVRVWLEGALPEDSEAVIRRVASELAQSPLGELSGAVQWSGRSSMAITRESGRGVRIESTVPWGALEALVNALAGRV
ncbi:MAG: hypothetical protein U0269_19225 [Polyangiales bacterium]